MFIKIPDEWRRKQDEQTLFRTIYSFAVPILLYGGLGITAIVLFFKNLRSEAVRAIPWRRLALWALWGLVAYGLIVGFGNRLQFFLNSYQTAIPFKTMLGGIVIGLLLGAVFYTGGLGVLFGIASYFSNRAFGEERLPVGSRLPALYYRDALWIGVCGTAGLLGLRHLIEFSSSHWQTVHRSLAFSLGQYFDAVLPTGGDLGECADQQPFLYRIYCFRCGVCGVGPPGALDAVFAFPAWRVISDRQQLGEWDRLRDTVSRRGDSAGGARLRRSASHAI